MAHSGDWQRLKEHFGAALDLDADARREFLASLDEASRREIEALIVSHEKAGDFIETPAPVAAGLADQNLAGRTIGEYRLVELIGTGGMGSVYLAEKGDLGRSFAVKLIKRGMDTDAVLRRFSLERRILARLEHPNIARLLDGGTTPDGIPYFVMEYVDGVPLTKFCRDRGLGVDERLALFRQVCSAVSYAHRNLVVHRDLKPSNIIVTSDGTPKLLDFGIAKLLGDDAATGTRTGTRSPMLTPEYASPEQIAGAPATTVSDVFSIGVCLYELLGNRRPFDKSRGASTSEPARLSTGSRRPDGSFTDEIFPITVDVDNIVMMALRSEPERRYQSVDDLSEDIRRHLAGLTVSATADSRIYRLRKFVGRHRRAVAATVAGVAVVFAALSFGAWQGIRAERERERAEKRFQEVRKLARLVVFDYHDNIEELPGSTKIRERMVRDSLEYLDSLAADQPDNPLKAELAATYTRIGDIQGNPYLANLGQLDAALESYTKAESIYASYTGDAETEPARKLGLAVAIGSKGDIYWGKGEFQTAIDCYRSALEIGSAIGPETVEVRRRVAGWNYLIGQSLRKMRDFERAREYFQLSAENYQRMYDENPSDPANAYSLATAFLKLGDVSFESDDFQRALVDHRRALDLLVAIRGASVGNERIHAVTLGRLSRDFRGLEQWRTAVEYDRSSVASIEKLVESDAKNQQFRLDLAYALIALGQSEEKVGRRAEGIAALRRSVELFRKERETTPDNFELNEELKLAEAALAELANSK